MWVALKVWIFIAVAAWVTVLFLKIAQRKDSFPRREIESGGTKAKRFGSSESVILYVMANRSCLFRYFIQCNIKSSRVEDIILKTTGQHYFPKRLTIRLAVGAWCCACFFLVQIYCCTLTSHLMSPNQKKTW